MLLLALTACSDDGVDTSVTSDSESAATPSAQPVDYSLENRSQFLASAPDCRAMTGWFEANPTDADIPTIAKFVEECQGLPQEFQEDNDVLADPAIVEAVLSSDMPAGSPARTAVVGGLAGQTCDDFGSGMKSQYQVAENVSSVGGSSDDYRAVLDRAQTLCPEHSSDMAAFTVDDVLGAGQKLRTYIAGNSSGATGSFEEWLALAQMICLDGSADAFIRDMAGLVVGVGNEQAFIDFARTTFCP